MCVWSKKKVIRPLVDISKKLLHRTLQDQNVPGEKSEKERNNRTKCRCAKFAQRRNFRAFKARSEEKSEHEVFNRSARRALRSKLSNSGWGSVFMNGLISLRIYFITEDYFVGCRYWFFIFSK